MAVIVLIVQYYLSTGGRYAWNTKRSSKTTLAGRLCSLSVICCSIIETLLGVMCIADDGEGLHTAFFG